MMLSGLRSRWTTPRDVRELDREADVDERAQQALQRERRARPARSRIFASVVPVSFFITKNGSPSASRPISCTGTIAGCSSRPWIDASRRNRCDRALARRSAAHALDRDVAADLLVARRASPRPCRPCRSAARAGSARRRARPRRRAAARARARRWYPGPRGSARRRDSSPDDNRRRRGPRGYPGFPVRPVRLPTVAISSWSSTGLATCTW